MTDHETNGQAPEFTVIVEDLEGARALDDFGVPAVPRPEGGCYSRDWCRDRRVRGRDLLLLRTHHLGNHDSWCESDADELRARMGTSTRIAVLTPTPCQNRYAPVETAAGLVAQLAETGIGRGYLMAEARAALDDPGDGGFAEAEGEGDAAGPLDLVTLADAAAALGIDGERPAVRCLLEGYFQAEALERGRVQPQGRQDAVAGRPGRPRLRGPAALGGRAAAGRAGRVEDALGVGRLAARPVDRLLPGRGPAPRGGLHRGHAG